MHMPWVKIEIRLKNFKPMLILNFISLLAFIIYYKTKKTEYQTGSE